jgi:galactokinase
MDLLSQNIASIGDENFKRARHAVTEIERVHAAVAALETNDFVHLGQLLNASHASLRDDYTVSCPELDVAVEAANVAGALGARMVGGGFGGSAIALVDTGMVPAVKAAVTDAYAASGFTAPRFFVADAAMGATISPLPSA